MRALTYLIYIIFWESLVLGGSIYLYGWQGWSGWWVVLGVFMSLSAYPPSRWGKLLKGYCKANKSNNEVKKTQNYCIEDFQFISKSNPNLALKDLGNLIGDALDLNIRWTNIREEIYNPDETIGHFTITRRYDKKV